MTQPLSRDLIYRILADTTGLDRGARAAERQLSTIERRGAMVDRAMTRVGRGMVLVGAAIAGGLALAVRAAIDWESAWAGVLKTVDGTPEQMAALEKEIRALTGILPASHREIAAVAEAAGQLGVQRENVAAFTKVMIDMGEATDLTADAAATAIARLMNIMQTAPGDVDRLASAIVDLGNKGATTESEITEMALRIAGAARTIGLTEQQVLGFAAALSNVGIKAEAGGTAISKVFLEIDTAVSAGGDNLEVFAETAGMTAAEFRAAYEQDAGAAIAKFIVGLGRVQETGGDVNAILDQLGLTNIRVSDALRRLAGSGDNLTSSLRTSTTAWEENTALAAEAERRYGTVEARIGIARNQVNDFAITVGQTFLPAVGSMVDTLGAVGAVIGDLPGPAKTALAILAAVTAAILLAGGAALLAVPRLAAMRVGLDTIAASSARGAAAVGVFRTAASGVTSVLAGPWGIALGIAAVAVTAFAVSQAQAKQRAQEFTDTLDQQTGAVTDDTRAMIAHRLEEQGALEIAQRHGIELSTLVDAVLGNAAARRVLSDAVRQNAEVTEIHGQGITKQSGEIVTMDDVVKQLTGDLDSGTAAWAREAEAVGSATEATEEMVPAAQGAATALNLTADEAGTLTDEVGDLDKALQALLGIMFGVEEAEDAAAQALRRVTEAAAENGAKLDGNSKAALANRDNVRNLISADFDLVNAMAEAGASADDLTKETERLRKKFIDQMVQAGFSEEAVEEYAEAYDLIPAEVETRISTPGMTEAERNARNLKLSLDRIPKRIDIDIHQSITAPVGSQRIGHQHGGEVFGPPGPDQVLGRALTAGEIIIRREVAQPHRAGLLEFNRTGRLPAALRQPNPAAAMAFSRAGRLMAPVSSAAPGSVSNVYSPTVHVTPSRLDFGPRELEAVMAAQEARLRVGRPR